MLAAVLMAVSGALKYSGSITAGATGSFVGMLAGSFGSRTPTTLIDGMTFTLLTDETVANTCSVRVSGFGADPGATYLRYVSAGGVTKAAATATYSYSAGAATWTWAAQTFGFINGGTYPVVMG